MTNGSGNLQRSPGGTADDILVVCCSLTSRSSPMDVASGGARRSQDGATVIADTCGSLPYATVIEAADSGQSDKYLMAVCTDIIVALFAYRKAFEPKELYSVNHLLTLAETLVLSNK